MRQSPTKITFNYHQSHIQPNLYSPRLIQSGFVLGEPITLTNQPQLPPNYHSFSPKISRPRAYTQNIYESRERVYEAPEPSQFAPPPHRISLPVHSSPTRETISRQKYFNLLDNYNILQKKYKDLEMRYIELQKTKQIYSQSSSSVDISGLIEKYKENLLHQCKLLMDRARLQNKQAQLSKRIK